MTKSCFKGVFLLMVMSVIIGCIAYVPNPPPQAMVEVRPAVPFPEAVWIGGYWAHRYGNWVWVPGYWGRRPWAGAIWVPGYWRETPRGYHWVKGHWGRP